MLWAIRRLQCRQALGTHQVTVTTKTLACEFMGVRTPDGKAPDLRV